MRMREEKKFKQICFDVYEMMAVYIQDVKYQP